MGQGEWESGRGRPVRRGETVGCMKAVAEARGKWTAWGLLQYTTISLEVGSKEEGQVCGLGAGEDGGAFLVVDRDTFVLLGLWDPVFRTQEVLRG